MSSWWMFLILDSISKTLHSLLMSEPVRNSLTLWNVEGLKAPLGFLMAALKGACSFLGLPKVLASGYVLENVMTPWVHTFALLSHPSLGMSVLKLLVLVDWTLLEEKLLLKK